MRGILSGLMAVALLAIGLDCDARATLYPVDDLPEGEHWAQKSSGKTKGFEYPNLAASDRVYGLVVLDCITVDAAANVSCDVSLDAPAVRRKPKRTYGFGATLKAYFEANYQLLDANDVPVPLGTRREVIQPIKVTYLGDFSTGDNEFKVVPTPEQIAGLYPVKAKAEGKGAIVLVVCRITDEAGHVSCPEAYATSTGYGFEDAAKTLVQTHGIAAKYYQKYINATGADGRYFYPFEVGDYRQAFIHFNVGE